MVVRRNLSTRTSFSLDRQQSSRVSVLLRFCPSKNEYESYWIFGSTHTDQILHLKFFDLLLKGSRRWAATSASFLVDCWPKYRLDNATPKLVKTTAKVLIDLPGGELEVSGRVNFV